MAKTDPDEALAALEEKGRRAIREERERADGEVGTEDRRKAEEAQRRVKLALAPYQGRRVIAAITTLMIAGFGVAAAAGALLKSGSLKDGITGSALVVGGLLFYVLIFNEPLYRLLGRVEAEERWLSTLPFTVSHYFEALREYRSKYDNGSPRFRVTFSEEGRAPSVEEIQVLLATLDPKVAVIPAGGGQREVNFEGRSPLGDDLVVLLHEVAPLLTLLHAKYPVGSLEVL